jgi:hypothetical protein
MPSIQPLPLGLRSAARVLAAGRASFFGSADADLPQNRSTLIAQDDLLPQFGYVGSRYAEARVLLLGINPGNGPADKRTRGDEIAMPALQRFVQYGSAASFLASQHAYQKVCESWPMWRRHCSEVIGAGLLSMSEVSYSNCLPWRTASESGFTEAVAERAAKLYAYPLIDELEPQVVIAMGKRAAGILALGGRSFTNLVVWNRAQAATLPVLKERAAAAANILRVLGRTAS